MEAIEITHLLEKTLGYVNFSSGVHDPQFWTNLDNLFRAEWSVDASTPDSPPLVRRVLTKLIDQLQQSQQTNPAFSQCQQAQQVLRFIESQLLSGYRDFHRDILFHQSDDFLFNSFFLAKSIEVVLAIDPTCAEPQQLLPKVIAKLNDYVGHRPVATLENQKTEPYPHEWLAPVPLYYRQVGVATGRYRELVLRALQILQDTDRHLLWTAQFDLDHLRELAIDPRALDFDHPVNRRPNHHFGQWDENSVDNQGYYSRFIVHQITLDAMLRRMEHDHHLPADQLLTEAGAVLACTILMGAGVSGHGPEAYDSSFSLSKLVPVIAGYRDQFYAQLLTRLTTEHRERLELEAQQRLQPFGAARQWINRELGNARDYQLIQSRLASLFARMGYDTAAQEHADLIAVASSRINTKLDCLLSGLRRSILKSDLSGATDRIAEIVANLQRGIECGAIVDPWNILGFDANYSLFPSPENSTRDHRIDDLVTYMNILFANCSRLWADAAASNQSELCRSIRQQFFDLSQWWRRYAAHEVSSAEAMDVQNVFNAAELVAQALNLWYRGGAATGDIEYWAQHAQLFDSASAYALVIEALLDRKDYQTSQALLVHWLSQADSMELVQADASFHELLHRWITEQKQSVMKTPLLLPETWQRIRKCYDFLEANAEHYWRVPQFAVGEDDALGELEIESGMGPQYLDDDDDDDEDDDDESGLHEDAESILGDPDLDSDEFSPEYELGTPEEDSDDRLRAAYEDITFQSESDDGIDANIFEFGKPDDAELEAEVERVVDRLDFLTTIARYWQVAATLPLIQIASQFRTDDDDQPQNFVLPPPAQELLNAQRQTISGWLDQALTHKTALIALVHEVNQYELPGSGIDFASLQHYDHQRLLKETLMQQIIDCCVQFENAIRSLGGMFLAIDHVLNGTALVEVDPRLEDLQPVISVYAAMFLSDRRHVVDRFADLNEFLLRKRLLYIPLSKKGDPAEIIQFRGIQSAIRELLGSLPGLGLLNETLELTETAMTMERKWPIDQGAVTEFDELFRMAFTSMVAAVVRASQDLRNQGRSKSVKKKTSKRKHSRSSHNLLFGCIEDITESMLGLWLEHSHTLRLSVLERVADRHKWAPVVKFIETYGANLFTQEMLQFTNLRAILHQGVDAWLYRMQQSDIEPRPKLLDDIDSQIPHHHAVEMLSFTLEAVYENYGRYRDYNASTTHSDRGELLYILLDFLRLEKRYDRILWHLRPVIWAHQVLVRQQEFDVAKHWRDSLWERVQTEAEKYVTKLNRLREKYSAQMASIGRHIEGRLIHPMHIDRLVALVAAAVRDPAEKVSQDAFEVIHQECNALLPQSGGAGLEMPDWLEALEVEVAKWVAPDAAGLDPEEFQPIVAPISISMEKLLDQIQKMPRRLFET